MVILRQLSNLIAPRWGDATIISESGYSQWGRLEYYRAELSEMFNHSKVFIRFIGAKLHAPDPFYRDCHIDLPDGVAFEGKIVDEVSGEDGPLTRVELCVIDLYENADTLIVDLKLE